MGKGKGAGSPIQFVCARCRKRMRQFEIGSVRSGKVKLTGRERPYRPSKYSALGNRSTLTSREYVCLCGHRGWSNHVDLKALSKREG